MPAKSQNEQEAAGAALAAKRGKIPVSSLKGASRRMYRSMTAEQLEHLASTKHKGLPRRVRHGGNHARRLAHRVISMAVLLVLWLGVISDAATWYLDKSNSAPNRDGTTWNKAWNSIAEMQTDLTDNAVENYGAGDTVLIRDGSYAHFYDNQDRTDWLILKADTGETAVNFTDGICIGDPGTSPDNDAYLRFEGLNIYANKTYDPATNPRDSRCRIGIYINGKKSSNANSIRYV